MVPRYPSKLHWMDYLFSIFLKKSNNCEVDEDLKMLEIKSSRVYHLSSGRQALALSLRLLDLLPKSLIGVPVFTCPVVVEAIYAEGHVPFFIDCTSVTGLIDMDDLSQKADKISALIVIHTFGLPVDVSVCRNFMGDKPIIEDCAQAPGTTLNGESLGNKGDFGVFSWGRHKPVSCGQGGMLVDNRKMDDRVLNLEIGQTSNQSVILNGLKSMLIDAAFYPFIYNILVPLVRRTKNKKKDYELNKLQINIEFENLFLKKWRSRVWDRWAEYLKGMKKVGFTVITNQNTFVNVPRVLPEVEWNHYVLPLTFEDEKSRDRALVSLQENGIDAHILWDFYCKPFLANCDAHSFPLFKDWYNRMLIIPTNASWTDSHLEEYVNKLQKVLQ